MANEVEDTVFVEKDEKTEAINIIAEINESSKDVFNLARNLKTRVEQGELPTENGIGLLDVKNHLLLQYLTNIIYLLLLKSDGKSINGDPVIERLVELRVVLERIRPIDQKLKYQIDKLIKIALTGIGNENDPGQFKANPANMISKLDDDIDDSEDEDGDEGKNEDSNAKIKEKKAAGVYVPPKLAAVHYDGDESKVEKQQRMLERARKYALNSSVMQELKEEYLETPAEVSQSNSIKLRQDKQQKYRQEYEENYFTRLPVTKEERQRAKRLSTLGNLGNEITHFEDISALEGHVSLKSSKKRKIKAKSNEHKKGRKRRRK